ncbi:MAG: hypothetical protein N2115_03060, partial [bacterium]|nr:hypothetical protein [bacterium]
MNKIFLKFSICFVFLTGILSEKIFAGEFFYKFYADAMKANLTGLSTYGNVKFGYHFNNNMEAYGYLTYEWADTTGTNLPFQYRYEGLTAGLEISYGFFYEDRLKAIIGYGFGLTGDVMDRNDFRIGIIGNTFFDKEAFYSDIYGELIWSTRADDIFLNLRYRPGRKLIQTENTRLWIYGVAQLYASGKGENGTENRIEAGPGIGYLFLGGKASTNLEVRFGHSFRGTITCLLYTS